MQADGAGPDQDDAVPQLLGADGESLSVPLLEALLGEERAGYRERIEVVVELQRDAPVVIEGLGVLPPPGSGLLIAGGPERCDGQAG